MTEFKPKVGADRSDDEYPESDLEGDDERLPKDSELDDMVI